jgi:outer membrane protein TolC
LYLHFAATALLVAGATGAHASDLVAPDEAASRSIQSIIEDYVQAGTASNLALADQSLEVERSQAALAAARARFLPEVALDARYTRADGGREITLPLGQLLNPAYQTLNDLLVASGAAPRFPAVRDEVIALQRPREQDTRITLRQPLYAPAVPAGVAAARAAASAADDGRLAYLRALRRDISVGYLDWLRARGATQIVTASAALLAENLRVNESLYANGKSTHDAVLRAQAEWLAVQQQQQEAENTASQARSYVNFLLNRRLDTPLEAALPFTGATVAGATLAPTLAVAPVAEATRTALDSRPELQQLAQAQLAADAQLRVARAARKPSLSLGVDAGTQGETYGLGRNYNFVTGSLVLNWTLFDAGAHNAAIAQARVASRHLANQREQAAARIELEVRQAGDNLLTASESLATATARATAARAAFTIASRRRDAGMASQLEFLDARSALTSAELGENLGRYALLQRQAEYDYARGDLP